MPLQPRGFCVCAGSEKQEPMARFAHAAPFQPAVCCKETGMQRKLVRLMLLLLLAVAIADDFPAKMSLMVSTCQYSA